MKGHTETLTRREIEVLKLIASGLSTKEVARSLGITFKTAACHRSRVMAKLDIHQVANLTRYAIRNRLIDAGEGPQAGDGQQELFDRIKTTEAKYRRAMEKYGEFLKERPTIGLDNPDGSTGARRLRQIERQAHEEYHAALVALKNFLIPE
jgi:DNA-binding CsgD family transcriptional regulator